MTNNWLISGPPGCGKTTVLQRLVALLEELGLQVDGIIATERRSADSRVGFDIAAIDGSLQEPMASHAFEQGPRVGSYRVDVQAIDTVVSTVLPAARRSSDVIIIDEIAAMQFHSDRFIEEVRSCLASAVPAVASIATENRSERLRMVSPDLLPTPVEVTQHNRDQLPATLASEVQEVVADAGG